MTGDLARPGLAALLVLLSGCAAPAVAPSADPRADLAALADRSAPDDDPSTVDVLLAPDMEFLARHGRDAVPLLVGSVETLDRVLGPLAGLRFRVGGAVLFPSTPGVRDDLRLLLEARLRVLRGRCDVVAAFTGQACGDRAGAAEPARRLLLCADASDPERNLLHEAAHLFGALDYERGHPGYSVPSPMSYDGDLPRTLEFDAPTAARIAGRAGALPPERPDLLANALAARVDRLPGPVGAALAGAFLCAESRISQRDGLAPAERALRDLPDDPVALWAYGECRRVEGDRDDGAALFLAALRAVAGGERPPDGLDRHVAVETARLAVDDRDGLGALRGPAAEALARLSLAFPADAELLDLRASLLARAGDAAGAATLYRDAAAADPAASYPWRHLAELGRTARDGELWLEGWDAARRVHGPDPRLGVQWVVEGLREFPSLFGRPAVRAEADAALSAAASAWPAWPDPARVRGLLVEATGR